MDLTLVRALLTILKYCSTCDNCNQCQLRAYCGKQPLEW